MQHLQPNTTLQGGKYRIERVLGQGGFGITYLAEQTSLQRKVAIKEFFMKEFCSRDEAAHTMSTPSTGSSKLVEQYRKKFIKEARNLARLNHPHIISVMDVFEENGTVYYVMPYLTGGSLQDYVKVHGPLSESMAMKYVKQIAGALKYMHEEQYICHYDVKPANILLDDKGNAVLIDFGISKNYDAAGQETTTTPVGMSEGYAPIEQYQQNVEEFSPVSDVYALGATLYFLLHGKRPVSAVHRASGIELLMTKQLSQGVKDIINTSMKISKRERAKSMDVFLKEGCFSEQKTNSFETSVTDDEETIIICQSSYEEDSKGIVVSLNNLEFRMVHVQGGTMTMEDSGSNGFFGIFSSDTRKQVILSDYYIGEVPVTQELWKYVMENNPSISLGDKKPVDSVSWNDCQQFIYNLNKITKLKFSLPTEAQWEFAARGGNSSRNLKYAGNNNADYVAWHWKNSNHQSQDVAKKLPNELGLFDMSGNVSEWCYDFFDNYISIFEKDPLGPHNGSEHVIRGGSWSTDEKKCRVSVRDHKLPTCRDNSIGLRLVLNKK